MELIDFKIGNSFTLARKQYRCTDIGTRTVVAIALDHPEDPSWYNGPPYAVVENVFDENDIEVCEPAPLTTLSL